MFERSEQKGSKPAARGIGILHVLLFEKSREEGLGQVLRVFHAVALPPRESVERRPVKLTQLRQRLARAWRRGAAGFHHHRPPRGGEARHAKPRAPDRALP